MMIRTVIGAALALLLTACVAPENGEELPEPVPPLAMQREQPQLALMEHILGNYFASDIARRPTVCVSVVEDGEQRGLPADDETALILRFAQLAPFDRCKQAGSSWVDAETDDAALMFTLHSFACEQATRCTGWAGYQAGAASSMSYNYTMDWLDGEWTFARDPRLIADEPGGAGIM